MAFFPELSDKKILVYFFNGPKALNEAPGLATMVPLRSEISGLDVTFPYLVKEIANYPETDYLIHIAKYVREAEYIEKLIHIAHEMTHVVQFSNHQYWYKFSSRLEHFFDFKRSFIRQPDSFKYRIPKIYEIPHEYEATQKSLNIASRIVGKDFLKSFLNEKVMGPIEEKEMWEFRSGVDIDSDYSLEKKCNEWKDILESDADFLDYMKKWPIILND